MKHKKNSDSFLLESLELKSRTKASECPNCSYHIKITQNNLNHNKVDGLSVWFPPNTTMNVNLMVAKTLCEWECKLT